MAYNSAAEISLSGVSKQTLVKWSDRPWDDPRAVKGLVEFAPTSLHCYTVGRNTLERSR